MFCGYCGIENAKDYSFCTGCGKPLESGIPNQPIQPEDKSKNLNTSPQDTLETISREKSVPQSKYLSVTWRKESPWPWQARSLDGRTLLGSYETEVKAAEVVAKFHGIDRMDLLIITGDSEKKRDELLQKQRKKVADEQSESSSSITESPYQKIDSSKTKAPLTKAAIEIPEEKEGENFKEPFGVACLPEKKPPVIWVPITLVICAYIWGLLHHFNWEVARAIYMVTNAPSVAIDAIGNIFPIVLGLIHLAISQFFKSKRNSYSRRYIIIYWSIAAFAVLLLASIGRLR